MLDNKNAKTSNGAQTENSMGLKSFSSTGREEAAVEILRPKTNPAVVRRNLFLIAVVIIAALVMANIAYRRSGLSFIPEAGDGSSFSGSPSADMPTNPR